MGELFPDTRSMFAAHGVTAAEMPFAHDGYSGATMSRIEQNGRRYVVKRVSRTVDWIIQMTSDQALREAQIGASNVLDSLAPGLRSPSIAAAYDGDGFALLMHDLTACLLPNQGRLPTATVDLILARLAHMHARFWDATPTEDIGWCGLRERLLMLSEPAGERLRAAGFMLSGGFAAGWEGFHRVAPSAVSGLVRKLHENPRPLIEMCNALPQTLLHNDVKTGNIAVEGDTVWLFDWALAGLGPVCSELGWLLGVNSSRLPGTLDETLSAYREHLRDSLAHRWDARTWERQEGIAHVSGLMVFGWAKVDDPQELQWWCDRALAAAKTFGWM
jgi:hypothetical protein